MKDLPDKLVVSSVCPGACRLVRLTHPVIGLRQKLSQRETIALSTNAKFHEIIEASKKQIRSGKTRTLDQMKREFGKNKPAKKRA